MRLPLVLAVMLNPLLHGCFEPPFEVRETDKTPRSFVHVDAGCWCDPAGITAPRHDSGILDESDGGPELDAGRGGDGGYSSEGVGDGGSDRDGGQSGCLAGEFVDAGAVGPACSPCRTDAGVLAVTLPWGLHEAAAFFDGQKFWCVGGSTDNNVRLNSIFSFDPSTQLFTTSPAALPVPEAAAYMAAKGSVLYVFGGDSGQGLLRSIVRFDSSTQTVTTMNAQLPTARYRGGTVWAGDFIYLIGGWNGGSNMSDILRYDTISDQIIQLTSSPDLQRERPAAFYLGGFIYITGGNSGAHTTYPSVIRFDPTTGTLTKLSVQNPFPRAFTGYGSDGNYGYLFGGTRSDFSNVDEIVRFDPVALKFDLVGTLAVPKQGDAYVFALGAFHTFGGMSVPSWTWFNSVQRWIPPPP